MYPTTDLRDRHIVEEWRRITMVFVYTLLVPVLGFTGCQIPVSESGIVHFWFECTVFCPVPVRGSNFGFGSTWCFRI